MELSALPEPLERIHKRLRHTAISIEDLEASLDSLVARGNIIGGKFYETKGRGKYYSKAQLAIRMYEFQGKNLTREFEKDFNEYMNETFHKAAFTKKTSQMRTILINKGFTNERYVGSYDNLREWIHSTTRPIAVSKCICRRGKDLLEDPCKHSDIRETCIAFEDAANWAIDAGNARAITKDETLEILERAENAGMVLQPENNQQTQFVCCCCGCCCHVLRSLKSIRARSGTTIPIIPPKLIQPNARCAGNVSKSAPWKPLPWKTRAPALTWTGASGAVPAA
ncbi:MAG: hypothetical protein PVG19_07460 [Desulfobacterales bacterium]